MIYVLPDDQVMYFRSMGKALQITAIATSDVEANEYMAKHDRAAVIAEIGRTKGCTLIMLADRFDKGVRIADTK